MENCFEEWYFWSIFGMVEDEGSIFISVKNYYYRVNNYRIFFIYRSILEKKKVHLWSLTKYILLFLFDFCINYMISWSRLYSPSGKCVSYSAASTVENSACVRTMTSTYIHTRTLFFSSLFIPPLFVQPFEKIVGIFIRESNATLT